MRLNYILFAVTFLVLACSQDKRQHFDIVIQNGNVIDFETGEFTQKDIFISAGKITKLSDTGAQIQFEAEKTIDAKGKYILPGFWDNHVHFRGGDSLIDANKNFLNLFIANGITTVRDAGGDLTRSVMDWKAQISKGNLIGPTIFTSGPKIDGPNATWAGSLSVENEADITKALDSLQAIPSDFVKLYDSNISKEAYLKTISEAENRNLITSGHMPFTVKLEEAIGAGIDAIEHLYYVMKGCSSEEAEITQNYVEEKIGFWDAMPALMTTYHDSTAQKTFNQLIANKVYVVPTLHIGETLSHLDEIDHTNDDYLRYMTKGIQKTYERRILSALNASEEARTDRKKLDAFFRKLTKTLNDANVGLLAGSDSGAYNSYTYPGISLHKELEALVSAGLSPIQALRTSAYNGAKFLKKDTAYGTIAEGKIADLVLLEENPLEAISNSKKLYMVIKGSVTLDKNQLKELLDSAVVN